MSGRRPNWRITQSLRCLGQELPWKVGLVSGKAKRHDIRDGSPLGGGI